jgi:hypothetical protein
MGQHPRIDVIDVDDHLPTDRIDQLSDLPGELSAAAAAVVVRKGLSATGTDWLPCFVPVIHPSRSDRPFALRRLGTGGG